MISSFQIFPLLHIPSIYISSLPSLVKQQVRTTKNQLPRHDVYYVHHLCLACQHVSMPTFANQVYRQSTAKVDQNIVSFAGISYIFHLQQKHWTIHILTSILSGTSVSANRKHKDWEKGTSYLKLQSNLVNHVHQTQSPF